MEEFISIPIKNEVLRLYIDSFYFHRKKRTDSTEKIVFFPNTKNALTIYKSVKCEILNNKPFHMKISFSDDNSYTFLYGGIQRNYVISEMHPPFDKIGIIFKPLGMNHFIDDTNLGKILSPFYDFPIIDKKMTNHINAIFETESFEKRVELLENLFLSMINQNFHEPILESAIKIIENYDGKIKISQLAEKVKTDEKTLLRKFKNHLNCSPKYYCKVLQFRKSLSTYLKEKGNNNLTDLALQNNYYDQSDFIKSFKALTGDNPKLFFKKINDFGNDIYWFK